MTWFCIGMALPNFLMFWDARKQGEHLAAHQALIPAHVWCAAAAIISTLK